MNVFENIRERLEEEYLQAEKDIGLSDTYDEANRCGGRAEAYKKAQKIINHVEQEYNNGWVSVNDRLPDYGVVVLLYDSDEGYEFGKRELKNGIDGFANGEWWTSVNNYVAWQPLPPVYVSSSEIPNN